MLRDPRPTVVIRFTVRETSRSAATIPEESASIFSNTRLFLSVPQCGGIGFYYALSTISADLCDLQRSMSIHRDHTRTSR